MTIAHIPIIAVSYNSAELIANLLGSLRKHYANKVYIIDGSSEQHVPEICAVTERFDNVEFIPFHYNIHHGPGMAWALTNLAISGKVLVLDSDVEIINGGFIESLDSFLEPQHYGVGGLQRVNREGYDHPESGEIQYLHPSCMLCNLEVMRQWPLPIKHGAPMIQTMLALHDAGQVNLIKHIDWVKNDNTPGSTKVFIKHDWQGTVKRTGSYHYDAESSRNFDNGLLLAMPADAQRIVELGCGDGAMARAYRTLHPICNYTGVEADASRAGAARPHCDFVHQRDIEALDDAFFAQYANTDCWVLGATLLADVRDPWALLAKIRKVIPANGTLVLSVPNAQHWSIQAKLNVGDLRYESEGLLDRNHLRWFTRGSALHMLTEAGFAISGGSQKINPEPLRERYLPVIRMLAQVSGNDPDLAVSDAMATAYTIVASPAWKV
jgi:SAM-dependent methyltransferase